MREYVAGLDIGTSKIACIIAEKDAERGIKIMGVGTTKSEGLTKGVVTNIDKTVQGIKKAVREAELMAGYDIQEVYVGIAGEHVSSINKSGVVPVKEGREITQEDVEHALECASAIPTLNGRETIDVVPQSYIVDDQVGIKDPIGMSGDRLETKVHIITAASTSAQNIRTCVEKAGLTVVKVVLEPLASSYSVLEEDEKQIGVALVDMGDGTTDIAIYYDDSLQETKIVAFGGSYVTRDIAQGIHTPIPKAEEIKKKYGCADLNQVRLDEEFAVPGVGGREETQVSRHLLTSIIKCRVEEILQDVARELELSGKKDRLGAGIVLTGGGALLEGIREAAERVFELPVKIGIPHGFSGLVDVAKSPIHATGIGLCMYGLKHEVQKESVPKKENPVSTANVKDMFQSVKEFFERYF